MAPKEIRLLRLIGPMIALTLVPLASARADFFDDMRKTFETDIPHFFQDDVPCAFGAKPTSGAKKSCNSRDHAPKHAPEKSQERAAAPPNKPNTSKDRTPTSGQ